MIQTKRMRGKIAGNRSAKIMDEEPHALCRGGVVMPACQAASSHPPSLGLVRWTPALVQATAAPAALRRCDPSLSHTHTHSLSHTLRDGRTRYLPAAPISPTSIRWTNRENYKPAIDMAPALDEVQACLNNSICQPQCDGP